MPDSPATMHRWWSGSGKRQGLEAGLAGAKPGFDTAAGLAGFHGGRGGDAPQEGVTAHGTALLGGVGCGHACLSLLICSFYAHTARPASNTLQNLGATVWQVPSTRMSRSPLSTSWSVRAGSSWPARWTIPP